MSATTIGAAEVVASAAALANLPTWVTFQVTNRCNYDCVHCFQTHDAVPELSTAEVMGVLDDLAASGIMFLTLMGGEFFMRRDADAILRHARGRKFAVKLITTGHHIDERRADLIRDLGSIDVHMSLYSAQHGPHDALTQIPGSWERTRAAAKRLIERKVPVTLQTPLLDINADDLDELAEHARALGARLAIDPRVTGRLDGDLMPTARRPDAAALRTYYGERIGGGHAKSDGDTPCRAAQGVVAIDAQGDVTPCNLLPLPSGNVREQRFLDIWRTSPQLRRVRALTWGTIAECDRCELRPYCNRCHALALVEDGKLDGPALECCRQAVACRDALRARGKVPATETAMPPTWHRVQAQETGRRSPRLRVLA